MEGTDHNPLASSRFHVAVCVVDRIVAHRVYGPGEDVTIGDDDNDLRVAGWHGASLRLISRGTLLHLQPGMRVAMGDGASGGTESCARPTTFEELQTQGVQMPMLVRHKHVNVTLREGISVFLKYLAEGEVARMQFR
jgi:hypothetical protein